MCDLDIAENETRNSKSTDSANTSSNPSVSGSSADDSLSPDSVFEVLIFKANDVVSVKAKDVDLDYGK